MMQNKTRAVLYARVSGDDRAKTGGENLADQLKLCREYALEHSYEVIEEFAEDDRGASGASFDLPELSRALESARAGRYDVLVVRELDRLSRELAKQLILEQELKRAGVSIEYVLYDFPDTPEGRLNKNLRAMLAEYEREKIKQRMTRGKLRKIRNGEAINHGHPPFGYENVEIDGRAALAVNEEEAKTVRLIYRWYLEGDGERGPMSIRAIAQRLTELGVPTYNDLRDMQDCTKKTVKAHGHWPRSSVGSILANETYTGTWLYGRRNWAADEQIPVTVPVIIDARTWEATQERRATNKRRSKRNRKHDYLMAGYLTCGGCGRHVIGNPTYSYYKGKRSGPILYYRCQAAQRGDHCGYGRTTFRAEWVDSLAWGWVRGLLTRQDTLEAGLRDYQEQREAINRPLRERLQLIDGLLAEIQTKLNRLLDLYLAGDFEREALAERKTRLETERASLTTERARLEQQLHEQAFSEDRLQSILTFADEIAEGIEQADQDFEKRRQIIEALDIRGELYLSDGEKRVRFVGALGETSAIVSSSSSDAGSHDRGSGCISAQTSRPAGGRRRA